MTTDAAPVEGWVEMMPSQPRRWPGIVSSRQQVRRLAFKMLYSPVATFSEEHDRARGCSAGPAFPSSVMQDEHEAKLREHAQGTGARSVGRIQLSPVAHLQKQLRWSGVSGDGIGLSSAITDEGDDRGPCGPHAA